MESMSTHPIQRFRTSKSVLLASECVFEFENFRNACEIIKSAQVDFFECNIIWWLNVNPYHPYNNNNIQFELKMCVKSEELWKSKQYQYRVSGTSKNKEIFGSSFKNVEKTDIVETFPSSYTRSALLSSLLPTESFIMIVKLEIKHIGDPIFVQKQHSAMDAKRGVLNQYWNLLHDSSFSDFTFIVKDIRFKVHKAILASASEIMRKMFTNNLKESVEGQCIVDHIAPHIFEIVLHFIYVGEMPVNLSDVSMELFKAAHYYEISKLTEICKEDIHFKLNADNALEICELATIYDMEDLKMDAWKIAKCQILKIFFPLKEEPLSLRDIREIIGIKAKEKEFWLKHKKNESTTSSSETTKNTNESDSQ